MKFSNGFIIALSIGLFSLSTYTFATEEQKITYKNERGSTMTLVWHQQTANAGTLTGTFTTAVGRCKEVINKPVPLIGYYNGNAVAITINYPQCTSTIAMTGNFTNGNQELKTLWLLARRVNDPLQKNWDSNTIGSDYFTKS